MGEKSKEINVYIGAACNKFAIDNINNLITLLKIRLQSASSSKTNDADGNISYQDCDIFSINELAAFLSLSLSEFNSTPSFTNFSFDEHRVLEFRDIIVEGAYIKALASKSLTEKGREFKFNDGGISYYPPQLAEFLSYHVCTLLPDYREKLKFIKAEFKKA